MKNSLLTLTGAGLISRSHSQSLSSNETLQEDTTLINRTLGKTGIKLPVISLGTGNTDNPNLVRSALDKGVTLFATSESYQNGNNESMVGGALKDKPRDSFIIMTSSGDFSWVDTQTGVYKDSFDPKALMQRLDESLKRLEVDYVDIFIQPFAATRESVFHEPVRKAMETVKKSGKAKYLGIATHRLEHEAIRAAVDIGIHDVIMTAYNFRRQGWGSMQNGEELDAAIQYAAESGLGIIAMKTMAGVYWDKERTKPINAKAALKWVIRNENIHTTVPGFTTFDQMESNYSIMADPALTEEEEKSLVPPEDSPTSQLFCRQCRTCSDQCPESVDIPTLMRSYMYAYAYRNLAHARQTLVQGCNGRLACLECESCRVLCDSGIDIRERLLDIQRLEDVPEDFLV
ncbi:MAG: aldo/keto reductase [Bacteroidales bacterium]|nr:aldo/keto reductase [Bacteroidales bacterium]